MNSNRQTTARNSLAWYSNTVHVSPWTLTSKRLSAVQQLRGLFWKRTCLEFLPRWYHIVLLTMTWHAYSTRSRMGCCEYKVHHHCSYRQGKSCFGDSIFFFICVSMNFFVSVTTKRGEASGFGVKCHVLDQHLCQELFLRIISFIYLIL